MKTRPPLSSTPPSGAVKKEKARSWALLAHRYVGLVTALFLTVAGLTGSLLAFHEELDTAVAPRLLVTERANSEASLLDPFVVSERVNAQLGDSVTSVIFHREEGRNVSFWTEAKDETWHEHFVDPYTGAVVGSRQWGNLGEGSKNLMPFIYRLHYSLALGDVGVVIFGIIGLLWTIDCFVGAYVTFPTKIPSRNKKRASWFRRWLPSWMLKTNQTFSLIFTWHRASGLWIWAMLFVFAWSAVGLNLNAVYRPVMNATLGMPPSVHDGLPHLTAPYPQPGLSFREAHEKARTFMEDEARQKGFFVREERALHFAADHGAFVYIVNSSLDISEKQAGTRLYLDGQSGEKIGIEVPTSGAACETATTWLYALHFGAVGGLPYRIFVSLLGLMIAALSVSGVWIWWKKSNKRARSKSSKVIAPETTGLHSVPSAMRSPTPENQVACHT